MSLLITNSNRTDNATSNYYSIPPQLAFHTCRLKQCIVTNNFENVTGQSYELDLGDGSPKKTVPIENGIYYASEYADYLETYLNAYSDNGVSFIVQYKETQQRFFVKVDNPTGDTVTITPNDRAQKFSGIGTLQFGPGIQSLLASNERANIFPSYYTLRSRSLAAQQIGYGAAARSDIIALIPISSTQVVSEYQCNDSVFPEVPTNENFIYNQIDLTFHLEDSSEIIKDPIFALKIEFR